MRKYFLVFIFKHLLAEHKFYTRTGFQQLTRVTRPSHKLYQRSNVKGCFHSHFHSFHIRLPCTLPIPFRSHGTCFNESIIGSLSQKARKTPPPPPTEYLTLKPEAPMASLSGLSHLYKNHHFKKSLLRSSSLPVPTPLLQTQPLILCFDLSLCKIRGSRSLRNRVLARAEDKARGSTSSSSSSFPSQQQRAQPNSENQLEVILTHPCSQKTTLL